MLFSPDFFQRLPYLIAALIPALTFHEWAHAFVAYKFGDHTAKHQGRLTLNPLAHLDPIGTLVIAFIGFGWAKPVPINPSNFRSTWGAFWVASAGPAMNMLLAIFFAILLNLHADFWFGISNAAVLRGVFQASLFLNLALCFFNLIPIGPLDGSHILTRLLPLRHSFQFSQWNMQYGGMFLLAMILIDQLTPIKLLQFFIVIPTHFVASLLLNLGF